MQAESAAQDRRARLNAQLDQAGAEGRAMGDDPAVAQAIEAWLNATRQAATVLLETGVPPVGLMSAMLGPTADLVAEVRDNGGP